MRPISRLARSLSRSLGHPARPHLHRRHNTGGQGQMDGFGNFSLVENSSPNGFSAAITSASFTRTDLTDLGREFSVLTPNGNNCSRLRTASPALASHSSLAAGPARQLRPEPA